MSVTLINKYINLDFIVSCFVSGKFIEIYMHLVSAKALLTKYNDLPHVSFRPTHRFTPTHTLAHSQIDTIKSAYLWQVQYYNLFTNFLHRKMGCVQRTKENANRKNTKSVRSDKQIWRACFIEMAVERTTAITDSGEHKNTTPQRNSIFMK